MTSLPVTETAPVLTFTDAEVEHIRVAMPASAKKTTEPGDLPGTVAAVEYQLGTDTITLTREEHGFVGYEYDCTPLLVVASGSGEGLEEALTMALMAGRQTYAREGKPWPWG